MEWKIPFQIITITNKSKISKFESEESGTGIMFSTFQRSKEIDKAGVKNK